MNETLLVKAEWPENTVTLDTLKANKEAEGA